MFRSLVLAGGLLLIACSGPGTSSPPDAPPTAPIDAAVDAPDACVSSPERCDGADSDCDGVADDPWQDVLGEACSVGVGACAAQGTVRCTADGAGAACDAVAGQPAATDMCGNDLDDDCDGAADEGCVCDPGETRPCGVDLGACELGTQTCSEAGAWGDCAGGVEPAAAELCNGADDDCDGPVDEGVTAACDTGIPGACRAGVATCVAGSFGECVALATPAAEVCNAIDDDCDGDTDEALTRGCGSDVGECQAGTATCRAGDWSACEGQIAPATETCDGRDEDCDGTPDDGCPAAARLLAPPNGHHTGSARAAATAAVRKPLRPRLRWRPLAGATTYQVQLDDSCTLSDFRSCALPSPEWSGEVNTTSATPPTNLPVGLTAPVGRTYFWRVRGCNGALCGPWSEVRYVHVGRLPDDVDGDGYSDVAVGAPRHDGAARDAGRVYLYRGGAAAALETTADAVLDGEAGSDSFGAALALADLDGDGFADLAVGAPFHDAGGRDAGRVYVYRGGPGGLAATPALVLDGGTGDRFGGDLAAPGDVDVDGVADLLIGAPFDDDDGRDAGRAYLLRGAADLTATTRVALRGGAARDTLGWSVSAAGDLDGDGAVDVVVGAPFADGVASDAGAAHVYRGGPGLPAVLAPALTLPGAERLASFGWAVAGGGDLDDDGHADLVIATHLADGNKVDEGRARVYRGSDALVVTTAITTLMGTGGHTDLFGWAAATAGDVTGDGYDDVVIGEPYSDYHIKFSGLAYLFPGGAPFTGAGVRGLADIPGFPRAGWSVASAGDYNGDGHADVAVGHTLALRDGTTSGSVFVYGGGPLTTEWTRTILEGERFHDQFGGAVAALPTRARGGRS